MLLSRLKPSGTMLNREFAQHRWCQTLSGLVDTEFLTIKPYEKNGHVLQVILNRAEKLNAFTLPFWKDLNDVFDRIRTESSCRSVVLSAAGPSFCAGIDLKQGLSALSAVVHDERLDVARRSRKLGELIHVCQRSFDSLERCGKPVIAAIHGHCIGAGISLAAVADVRYATCDAVFSIKEVDIGIAADVGILNRINRLVANDSLTRELAFTARDLGASEALAYGFVSRVFSTRDECSCAALALASEIASRSPVAVQGTKLMLNYARDNSVRRSLEFMRLWNQSQLQCDDVASALLSANAKEVANFQDV